MRPNETKLVQRKRATVFNGKLIVAGEIQPGMTEVEKKIAMALLGPRPKPISKLL